MVALLYLQWSRPVRPLWGNSRWFVTGIDIVFIKLGLFSLYQTQVINVVANGVIKYLLRERLFINWSGILCIKLALFSLHKNLVIYFVANWSDTAFIK